MIVAVCCSVLQRIACKFARSPLLHNSMTAAVCCSVLQRIACACARSPLLHNSMTVAVCCSVLQRIACEFARLPLLHNSMTFAACCRVLQRVECEFARSPLLQSSMTVAVWRGVFAVSWSALHVESQDRLCCTIAWLLQCDVVCLQSVACSSVSWCVAVCCSALQVNPQDRLN